MVRDLVVYPDYLNIQSIQARFADLGIEQLPDRFSNLVEILEADNIDEEVFDLLHGTVIYSYRLREVAGILLAMAVSIQVDIWDSAPLTRTTDYKDVWAYAQATTGYSRKHLQNMARAGRIWLLDAPAMPDQIMLFDRNGCPTHQMVIPNPLDLSLTKLIYSARAIGDGSLWENPKALGQLFNPDVPANIFYDTMQESLSKTLCPTPDPKREMVFYMEDSLLLARGNGEVVVVAQLNFDERHPLLTKAFSYLKAALDIYGLERS